MRKKTTYILSLFIIVQQFTHAQNINILVANTKSKIEQVKDYTALGKMKTNVAFLKLPIANVKVYFKNPNKFKLKSEKGVSFVPKGSMNINLNSIFTENNFTIIDAGSEKIDNITVRVAKLLSNDDNSDLVLTTLYIDPVRFLILKSKTTTKESGTYELKMNYNKYATYSLPDKILFSFNTKDYKLPKGITFDFDDGTTNSSTPKTEKYKKGEIEILFSNYEINKGISNDIFK